MEKFIGFTSVRNLANYRGVGCQAILDEIGLGKLEAVQVGHDWRIMVFVDMDVSPQCLEIKRVRRVRV